MLTVAETVQTRCGEGEVLPEDLLQMLQQEGRCASAGRNQIAGAIVRQTATNEECRRPGKNPEINLRLIRSSL